MAHELPPLPYDYAALEPVIDKQTMTLHHDMHHGAYVKNLNAAIEKHPELSKKTPEDLIRDLNSIPEDIRAAVRNNAGGHVNHTMFWKIMKPKGGGDPNGPIAQVITKTFGNFKDFQTKSSSSAPDGFGLQASKVGTCKSSPLQTRTIPSPKASFPSSATTFGSTPTT
jgi:Fe-Mn family superoxide dismutase